MAEKSAEANAFKLARAKSNATSRTFKLLLFVQGGFALVMATVMTIVLTLLHVNTPGEYYKNVWRTESRG